MKALIRRLSAAIVIVALGALPVRAQQPLDRSKIPPPGKAPELRVPTWTKATLANGIELFVSEKHNLPLVSFSLLVMGGANQFEAANRRGVASLTASMMSEGTTTRDGEALSNALQLLGTSVNVGIGSESGSLGFVSTTAKFAPTLDILADMLRHSTFPAPALEMLRADAKDHIYYQVLDPDDRLVSGDKEIPALESLDTIETNQIRFRDEQIGDEDVRIAYTFLPAKAGSVLIQVAETRNKRRALVASIVSGVMARSNSSRSMKPSPSTPR